MNADRSGHHRNYYESFEPIVGPHRARLDESAGDGVPAHITALYPFLAPASINNALLASLGSLFAGASSFEFTLG